MSKHEYTREQIEELRHCAVDPTYFIRNYFHIKHMKNDAFLFDMYPYQQRLVNRYNTYDKNISLASRQSGSTTCLAAYTLWYALFNNHCAILLASNTLSNARSILDNIRYAIDRLPKWMRLKITTSNRSEIRFETGSYIYASAVHADTARGRSLSMVVWDLPMFTRQVHALEFWQSIQHQFTANTKIILANSGTKVLKKDEENLFATLWHDALADKNGLVPTTLYWDDIPHRGEEFEKWVKEQLGDVAWKSEYLCEFMVAT